ncbi:MAG: 4Fe-4S dicluster domain-containing protein [bacterium]
MTACPPPVRGHVLIRVERCKGCQFCVEFCPQHVLRLSTDFNAKGYHYPIVVKNECILCSLCLSLCPEYAIQSRPPASPPAAATGPARPDAGCDCGIPTQGTKP